MTDPTEIAAFDHAFIATRSLLGYAAEIPDGTASRTSAEALSAELRSGDQKVRATALAKALAKIVVALERRRP